MHAPPANGPLFIIGTRPEAIKLAPIIREFRLSGWSPPFVLATGQHPAGLHGLLDTFGIAPDIDLRLHVVGQTPASLIARGLEPLTETIRSLDPAVTVVQGDTTSTLLAALGSFFADVPVAHVEAGLRTGVMRNPYPEEMNRRLTTCLASLHFAPTVHARVNLLNEGVSPRDIIVTGNSVIDALRWATTLAQETGPGDPRLAGRRPIILVTVHRRESWGPPMQHIADALRVLAERNPRWQIVLPMHPNPIIGSIMLPTLGRIDNVVLLEPLPYVPFVRLLQRCRIVLTDSGGIQEEAPSLAKPVLVMRETTERPEGLEAGTARLIGTSFEDIVTGVQELIDDKVAYAAMARAVNPYGDGRAARRTVQGLRWRFDSGGRPKDFAA